MYVTNAMRCRPLMMALLFLSLHFTAQGQSDAEKRTLVYTLQKGEGIADVAERFLGDASLATELLNLNRIANPAALVPGMLIALPGEEREKALAALDEAVNALTAATTNGAPEFAKMELDRATASFLHAEQSFNEAAYDKANSLARVAVEAARLASALADKRAASHPEAVVKSVYGRVEASRDGDTWETVAAGRKLAANDSVRTGDKSRAEIRLPEGSIISITENSHIRLDELFEDLRQGRTRMMMRLLMGDIMGRITPKKTPDSKFELKVRDSAVAIRGTVLRVGADEDEKTRIMLDEGEVSATAKRKAVKIEEGMGLTIKRGQTPGTPVPLLPAPAMTKDWGSTVGTADQTVLLDWRSTGEAREEAFRVEVAGDEAFQKILINERTRDPSWTTVALKDGNYFWRVCAIDGQGLEGTWSKPAAFSVARNLEIKTEVAGHLHTANGVTYALPGVSIVATPARDDTSVEHLEASVNRAAFAAMDEGTLVLRDAGTYLVDVRGVGADGETGPWKQTRVTVDGEPPLVSVRSSVDPGKGKLTVELDAKDDAGVAVTRYDVVRKGMPVLQKFVARDVRMLDSRQLYAHYANPIVLDWPGEYEVHVRAADILGNTTDFLVYKVAADGSIRAP